MVSHARHDDFLNLNRGKTADVLFEKTRINGMITGYTGNYIRVEYPWKSGLAGQIRRVMLKEVSNGDRMGIELID